MRFPFLRSVPVFLASLACADASSTITQPFACVRYTQRRQTVPRPLNLHIVEIDLTHPGIRFLISPSNGAARGENSGQTVRTFVTSSGAQLGINASFFLTSTAGGGLDNRGVVASRGDVYSPFDGDNRPWPVLNIAEDNFARILSQAIQPSTTTATLPAIPLYNAVSGSERVVTNGRNTAGAVPYGEPQLLHPRTAVGITADRRLVILVCDGRNSGISEGLYGTDTAEILINYGVVDAINLDGGGSTTLVLANPTPLVMNRPSDGTERTVGAILAVFAAAATTPRDAFVFADFYAGDRDGFSASPAAAGSLGVLATTAAATVSSPQAFDRGWFQRLTINDDPAVATTPETPDGGWFVRHAWTAASTAPTARATRGSVGFWARTSTPGIQTSLTVAFPDGTARARQRPLPADGLWHLCEWHFANSADWPAARDTAPIPSGATFTLDSLQFFGPNADAVVDLDLVAHHALGSLADEFAPPHDGRLANASIRATVTAAEPTLTIGLTVAAGSAPQPMLVRAIGPSLAAFGVAGSLADPLLTISDTRGTTLATNDNWSGSPALVAAIARAGAFPFASATSLDAAAVLSLDSGGYLAHVTAPPGASGIAVVEAYHTADPLAAGTSRFLNVSARAPAGAAAETLITGFVIAGGTKRVLLRAVGPGLTAFGVAGALADPQLTVFAGASVHALNDDWGGGPVLTDAFTRTGAFALPAASRDAALLLTLAPGAYSAHVEGANGSTGLALLEVYEVP